MEDGSANGITVRNTHIINCVLEYVVIHNSTIERSTLSNCNVFNAKITESTVLDSKLHDTPLGSRCSVTACKVTTCTLALREFPPEIRDMIVRYCMEFVHGKTPPLLIALRGDPDLYQQALKFLYRLNPFVLDAKTILKLDKISKKVLKNITKLSIM